MTRALWTALGGCALWMFSFAVGFRAFSTGRQAGGVASGLTLGLPILLFVLMRAKLETLAAFVPTAACYLPLKTGVTMADASSDLNRIAAELEKRYPRSNAKWRTRLTPLRLPGVRA